MDLPRLEVGQTWFAHGVYRRVQQIDRGTGADRVTFVDENDPAARPTTVCVDDFLHWIAINRAMPSPAAVSGTS